MKKRSNGEGSIVYHKATKRYMVAFTKPNGKRCYLYGKTRAEAKEKLIKTLSDIQNNTFTEKSKVTLVDILKEHIENKYNTNQVGARTYKRDLGTLSAIENCCKEIVTIPIQKITVYHIRSVLPNITRYSNNTINKIYRMIGKGFKIAISNRIITYNPMENEDISKPKSNLKDKEVEALTLEEQKHLVQVLEKQEHKYKNIILLQLYTGMRIGEVLSLKNEDIDLLNNTISIKRTLTRDVNDKVILGDTTKTENSKRIIPINEKVKQIIKNVQETPNINGFLFYDNVHNTFVAPHEINSYLKRLNAKEHISSNLHSHMLRHTFATRCIESGMQAKVLQKILGHKKIETTLDTYTSIFKEFSNNEINKVTEYLIAQGL